MEGSTSTQTKKNLYKALAAFQQEVPAIYKGTSGYGYKYADWSEILKVVNPLLKKHGLGFSQPIVGTQLETIVFHAESGESIESLADIPQGVELKGMNAFQVAGSAITYYRRYALSSILGLVTDEDADAAGEQAKKPVQARVEPQSKPQASPNKPASDAQINLAYKLLEDAGFSDDDIGDRLKTVKSSADASALIEKTQSFLKEKGGKQ